MAASPYIFFRIFASFIPLILTYIFSLISHPLPYQVIRVHTQKHTHTCAPELIKEDLNNYVLYTIFFLSNVKH